MPLRLLIGHSSPVPAGSKQRIERPPGLLGNWRSEYSLFCYFMTFAKVLIYIYFFELDNLF